MPPRVAARAQAPAAAGDGAGPGPSGQDRIPEYVSFTFAQTLLAAGYMPESEAKVMVRRLLGGNADDASYRQLLQQLNNQVSFLEMQFERIRLPADDQWYVCATNKSAKDSAVKAMGSRFSAEQRDFFRAVVEAIGAEPPADDSQVLAAVSQITLINLDVKRPPPPAAAAAGDGAGPSQAAAAAAPGPKKALGKGEREAALQALAADGWLVAPRAGYYTLGPRTLAELKDLVEASVPEETAVKLREKYL